MPLGESLAQLFGDAFDFKITASAIANQIAESPQFTGEFVIVSVLGKPSGAQQFVILERLPTILHRVKSGVEYDAMRVQMGIKGTRSIVREQRSHEVAGQTVALFPTGTDARCRKRLEFPQRRPDRPRVRFQNSLILAHQSRDGNRLRR